MTKAELTKAQRSALRELGEPGHYRVNWRPKLSERGIADLRARGLIKEVWTWASGTRPDTGITPAGRALIAKEAEHGGEDAR